MAGRKPAHERAVRAWKQHRPKAIGALARHLGITAAAVSQWLQVPASRLDAVADWLGVDPADLRPDLRHRDPWSALLLTPSKET